MAQRAKGLGPVRRFGPRYGRTTKHRLAAVELEQKAKHKCPYCGKQQIRRVAAGIFTCKKCASTFTGKAYVPAKQSKKPAMPEATHEETPEEEEEVEA